ncbi:MAG: hypothetical protein AAFY56_16260 [Pseudomonadota bacterium]
MPRGIQTLFILSGVALVAVADLAIAQSTDAEVQTVADAVRSRGHQCDEPRDAERDTAESRPDVAVWTITCEEGRYQVTFEGDAGVDVEPLAD